MLYWGGISRYDEQCDRLRAAGVKSSIIAEIKEVIEFFIIQPSYSFQLLQMLFHFAFSSSPYFLTFILWF